jgi:hypothetical protein
LERNDKTRRLPGLTCTADSKTSTESGISIEEQQGKGIENRNRTADGESNVNDCNPLHIAKHSVPTISTELGTLIVRNEHLTNVPAPACESRDPDSKVTFSSDVQASKQ